MRKVFHISRSDERLSSNPMADFDKWKTALICHQGLFQYRRMPFGLTNVPATFQRLMGKLFNGKEWDLDDSLEVNGGTVWLVWEKCCHFESANLQLKFTPEMSI